MPANGVRRSKEAAHYEHLARFADVWIFGAPNCDLSLQGVVAVPIPNGAALLNERGVVIESASFGAALFAHREGLLHPSDPDSSYYEGFLTTTPKRSRRRRRLASLLKLAPMSGRWVDHDLVGSWYARINRRIMEVLESERLQLRAREDEISKMREESERMEKLVRGYVGGQTWDAARNALESNQEEIADLERQELTICFCDLVGFTKLSERLTPPQIAGILNDHFGRLYNIVRVHGGTIDKFIGDCMLAYFPEPVEAFEASKKMVQESREVRPIIDWAVPIQVRVGLNTGFVAVANLGVPEIRQRTILGEAVNFAQRMQSAAPPHSLLLSERTLARLPHHMIRNLEPLKVEIKGKKRAGSSVLLDDFERAPPGDALADVAARQSAQNRATHEPGRAFEARWVAREHGRFSLATRRRGEGKTSMLSFHLSFQIPAHNFRLPIKLSPIMRIDELFAKGAPTLSFEFFPPKNEEGETQLMGAIEDLKPLSPSFVSITRTGGGAPPTIDLTARIQNEVGFPSMSHLTCAGYTRDQIGELLDKAWDAGIRNILALRGDAAPGQQTFSVTEGRFRQRRRSGRIYRQPPPVLHRRRRLSRRPSAVFEFGARRGLSQAEAGQGRRSSSSRNCFSTTPIFSVGATAWRAWALRRLWWRG